MFVDNFKLFFNMTVIDNRPGMKVCRERSSSQWRLIQTVSWPYRIIPIFVEIIFTSNFLLLARDSCERFADSCLAESRYWWGGQKIELYYSHLTVNKEKRQFTTIVDKVKSLAAAFFLFFPGVLLKSLVWVTNFSHIYLRNQLIREIWNTQNLVNPFCLPKKIKPREFDKKDDQAQSAFMGCLPEIKMLILTFLKDEEQGRLALTCKKNHCLIADFQIKTKVRDLPAFIVQSMTEDNLIPETFPKSLQTLFDDFKANVAYLDMNKTKISPNHAQMLNLPSYPYLIEIFFKWMGNHAIKTIETAEGLALIVHLKNNIVRDFSNKGEAALIITKMQGKWAVSSINTSGAMWLFLNDMRFSDNLPELKDYLERLFKGESCGNFSDEPYFPAAVQINYQAGKAATLLPEGLRTCADGVTPVMQLWHA